MAQLKHAPGWSWRKLAGKSEQPWDADIGPGYIGGLCRETEYDWHSDCPQSPVYGRPVGGQCCCQCHRRDAPTLF